MKSLKAYFLRIFVTSVALLSFSSQASSATQACISGATVTGVGVIPLTDSLWIHDVVSSWHNLVVAV